VEKATYEASGNWIQWSS